MIDRIIYFLNINTNNYGTNTNSKSTRVGKPPLNKYLSGKPRREEWNYQTAVVILTYSQGNSRPEMSITVNKTALFRKNPMLLHGKDIKQLG